MKLLLCLNCFDVFKLDLNIVRSCKCGKVKGQYLDNEVAESNGQGVCLAIGNGSLLKKTMEMSTFERFGLPDNKTIESGKEFRETFQVLCWVRPNDGIYNPNMRINRDL